MPPVNLPASRWWYNLAMRFWNRLKQFFRGKKFLCDDCSYDYPSACTNPERPNATSCPDYHRRF